MMAPASRLCATLSLLPLLALLLPPGNSAPFRADDTYVPACGGLLPDPPPGGWQPWSSPATWGGSPVPGVGAHAGVNVSIPCGVGVLLDVPLVQLGVLDILGALKLQDDPSLPLVNLTASFVLVQGRFIIGSAAQQFGQRAEIRLAPNPNNRAPLLYTSRPPADPANPRSLGHKAFAVVGGQVDFHGLPGPASMLTWTKLVATARAGDSKISVKGDVSNWPVGVALVIAPTDFYPDQEDVRSITGIVCASGGAGPCNVSLDSPLAYNHYGDPLGVPDGFGGFIDETAEVALLSRRIVITGTDEVAPYQLEGGHFIVYMTQTQQFLEGVQFLLMGQQGTLGRYNIHFHVCGNQQDKSVIRKNLMLHSKQRCVVIHATHNAAIEANVAYNTSGHCFMVEEGGEQGNTFLNNLGLRTRAVVRKISDDETDDVPSTFWITNPNNNYIGNAAGGSDDSGFWMELRYGVRGLSLQLSALKNIIPIMSTVVGKFVGNTAHSNLFAGYRAYPKGFFPRYNASADGTDYWDKPVWVEIGSFNLWKNNQVGAFIHNNDHVVFSNSTFADNVQAIRLQEVQAVNVTGHRIVGESNNYGNPRFCQQDYGKSTCGPISGCAFPLAAGVAGRSVPWGLANQSILGVVFDQNRQYEDGSFQNLLANTSFSAFNSACKVSAAIAVGANRQNFWNSGHGFRSVKFSTATVTNKVYLFPRTSRDGDSWTYYSGEVASMYAIRDLDGSVLGAPGYVVANNSAILPPASFSPQCSALPKGNAYACAKTCYRTIQLLYFEPGFSPYDSPANYGQWVDGPRQLGDFSYIQVKRVEDGRAFTMEGNLRQYRSGFDNGGGPYNDTARTFPMSLLAGFTYEVAIIPGTNNPSFVPQGVIIHYKDGSGCGQGLTLRFLGSTQGVYSWAVQPSDVTSWSPCPGNVAVLNTSVAPVQYTYACSNATSPPLQALQLVISPLLPPMVPVTIVPSASAPAPCGTSTRCGLTATRTVWFYNQLNQDLHPAYPDGPAFYNPLFPTPAPDWLSGPGVLGFEGWPFWGISTFLKGSDWSFLRTYYFKTSFNLSRSACYSTLYLDLVVLDGVILYLNNRELLRVNMPAGTPDNMTQAVLKYPGPSGDPQEYKYYSFSLPLSGPGVNYSLVEKLNYLAAEVHVNVDYGWNVGFALRASVSYDTTCTAPKVATEVCDGVDNNNDGKVDVDPATNKLLQWPCFTACGSGFLSCIRGAFQNCTAPQPSQEICNGKDDNCDGLIDNGNAQLDCPAGSVCFGGKCQPVQDLTVQQVVWPQKAPNWLYLENGVDLSKNASWQNGSRVGGTWKSGSGDFGIFPDNTGWTFSTALDPNSNGQIYTRYFVKNFSLSAADRNATFGYALSIRRCDGAVVYLNGRELLRSNMPAGAVGYTTPAAGWAAGQDPTWDNNALRHYSFGPLRAYGLPSIAGTNWIAVELHSSYQWQNDWILDLNLTRYVIQPCAGTTACIRRLPVDTPLVNEGDAWSFLDASLPLPSSDWASVAFNDSAWLTGGTQIGQPWWVTTKMTTGSEAGNGRITYYFRKVLTVADGACYFNLTMNVFGNDGLVVYINGAEAVRVNMPAGNISATTGAAYWPSWTWTTVPLSAGWLKNGKNVIAAEVHQYKDTADSWLFDLTLSGQREGLSCTPLPP